MTHAADSIGSGAGTNGFDPTEPNVARIYDYLLGGKNHFAADRRAAKRLLTELPNASTVAKANRVFLTAAVRQVAAEGVRQYLDIGAGLPTSPSVHECAREVVPGARVAYVDNDPVAVTHARALLATDDGVIAVEGDARRPDEIFADPRLAELIDFAEPVCVLLVSMLHFFAADEADAIVDAFRRRMAPGSYLVISAGDANDADVGDEVHEVYGRKAVLTGRPATEIAAYFDGFDLLPPGLVSVTEWSRTEPTAWPPQPRSGRPRSAQASMLAGLGRKRGATS